MNAVANSAVLQFVSDTNERIRITIPRACHDITEPQARAAMEAMIAGGVIVTQFGRPASIHSMEIIATTRTNVA
ncbi:MAG: DUF2922 domain-containing protein [Defluviitaleaceae bacterium]|nr:DUF2922 domain-containing protein [Defluviitaleaceae bacterium]